MTFKALFYAYVLGGITFIPLVVVGLVFFTIYTSVPLGDADVTKAAKGRLQAESTEVDKPSSNTEEPAPIETNDVPRTRKGWLTMRRTFEESGLDGGYVTLVRSFLDARSKDPKRSRPKDMWYAVLKGNVLYLYEDEEMTECEAAIELSGHDVIIYPEGLLDGELFAKRNAICLKPKVSDVVKAMPSVTKEMKLEMEDVDTKVEQSGGSVKSREKEREKLIDAEKTKEAAREEAVNPSTPWFIFVRSNLEMEDWYFSLIHASDHPAKTPTLSPLQAIFQPSDMSYLVATLDEQPDVIPMRWLNALIGRIFFSYYRTHTLEAYIIGRLMKKLSKVKRPAFLTDIVVTEVSVGNKAPTFSKPMLKELTKEGDASLEVHLQYKGEFRITIEATATINLSARFKSYTVKLVLAAVLKELEGNLLVKVKRPPSNRIWYAFTQPPRMVLEVEPIVSDRQITWGMILSTIESRLKEIIQESVVLPNMDDIAFFESSPYQHRGGIWQDASRHERQQSLIPEQPPDDTVSTASEPTSDAQALSTGGGPSLRQHSQPAEELLPAVPSPSLPAHASGTILTEESPMPLRATHGRRRSWFSSVRSEDLNTLSEKDIFADVPADENIQRGRSTEPERATSSLRSQSTPHKPESLPERSDQDSDDLHLQTYLSPQAARRSSSQHSPKREHTKSSSNGSSSSAPDTTSPKSSNSTLFKAGGVPPSPNSSFLSTLKSRAGDKQALSNTAKEAMRKWGVNWGGLRKDSNGGHSTGDEVSDHGSIGSRLRTDATNSVAQRARASYAEVRAAVAERQGRDKNSNGDDVSDLSRSSSPVTIPEGTRGKARAVSNPLATVPQESSPSSYPDSVSLSSSSSSSSGHPSSTRGSGSKKYPSSISRVNSEPDRQEHTDPNGSKHAPILVQPQGKTMTIPGIHVSHRGDVMSMGYAAPQPQTQTDGKSKNPSIQSVYRLWKSPVLSGQDQQPQHVQDSASSAAAGHAELGNRDGDIVPLSLPPNVQSPPQTSSRPIPPPLPPRSTPIAISRPSLEPPDAPSDASPPSASEALKFIANKDERTRASLENSATSPPASRAGTENLTIGLDSDLSRTPSISTTRITNSGPPLPPRRIQA